MSPQVLGHEGDGVYDVDGEFIANLDQFFRDDNWQMCDEDGRGGVEQPGSEALDPLEN